MHLVLLPGLDGTGELFAPLVEALPAGVAVTIVGYPHDTGSGYAGLRQLVERAIPVATDYVLVAESFSGPLAIELAAAQPPGLRALILCATFAACPLPRPLTWLARRLARPWLLAIRPPTFLLRLFLLGGADDAAVVALIRAAIARVDPSVLAGRVRAVLGTSVCAQLPAVSVPVLYLAAARDRLVRRRARSEIAKVLPDMGIAVIDAPHLLLQVAPAEAAERMLWWLSGVLDER